MAPTVTNPLTGVVSRDRVRVSTLPEPVIDIQPDPALACRGGSIVLDAGPDMIAYEWSTGDVGRFLEVSPTATTTYDVTVTNVAGCQAAGSRTVVFGDAAVPRVSVTPARHCDVDPAVFVGDATATAVPAGSTIEFAWSILGSPSGWSLAPADAAVTTISATAPLGQPNATVRLTLTTRPSGCATSLDFPVEVVAPPIPSDVGNSLMAVRTATGLDLYWAETGASPYEVYSVDTKTSIPTIDLNLDTTSATTSVSIATTAAERYYQVGGDCP